MATQPITASELEAEYLTTFRQLRGWFVGRGIGREEAADLAQDTIARALLHVRRRGPGSHETLWPLLMKIASNLLVDRFRSSAPRVVSLAAAEGFAVVPDDPESEVARAQSAGVVREALERLPDRQREALQMTLEGKSAGEIGRALGLQANAVHALLFRARKGLASMLRSQATWLLGVATLLAVRVRMAARRVSGTWRMLDPASAPVALIVVAMLTPPVAGAVGGQSRAAVVRSQDDASRVAARAADAGIHDRAGRAPDGGPGEPSIHVSNRIKDPVTQEEHAFGVRIWKEEGGSGDEDEGVVGGIVRDAITTVCAVGGEDAC
ncbi:MAG TPA: sigma-70 family RNA polymerase sigma factor [Actinomycetota bacterium]